LARLSALHLKQELLFLLFSFQVVVRPNSSDIKEFVGMRGALYRLVIPLLTVISFSFASSVLGSRISKDSVFEARFCLIRLHIGRKLYTAHERSIGTLRKVIVFFLYLILFFLTSRRTKFLFS
jgi:hypothetical protein